MDIVELYEYGSDGDINRLRVTVPNGVDYEIPKKFAPSASIVVTRDDGTTTRCSYDSIGNIAAERTVGEKSVSYKQYRPDGSSSVTLSVYSDSDKENKISKTVSEYTKDGLLTSEEVYDTNDNLLYTNIYKNGELSKVERYENNDRGSVYDKDNNIIETFITETNSNGTKTRKYFNASGEETHGINYKEDGSIDTTYKIIEQFGTKFYCLYKPDGTMISAKGM